MSPEFVLLGVFLFYISNSHIFLIIIKLMLFGGSSFYKENYLANPNELHFDFSNSLILLINKKLDNPLYFISQLKIKFYF